LEIGPGEFSTWDGKNYSPDLAGITGIFFKGVDRNGVRPVRDDTAVLWEGKIASAFIMLNSNKTRTYLRINPLQGSNQHVTLAYDPDEDMYDLFWNNPNKQVITSTFTRLTKSQVVNFYCPDLFF
jgi:hypothetical protein